MLLTETNTRKVQGMVLNVAQDAELDGGIHGGVGSAHLNAHFEHGQWRVECPQCGAQWSACDSDHPAFVFEQVSEGDGYCLDHAEDDCENYD